MVKLPIDYHRTHLEVRNFKIKFLSRKTKVSLRANNKKQEKKSQDIKLACRTNSLYDCMQ